MYDIIGLVPSIVKVFKHSVRLYVCPHTVGVEALCSDHRAGFTIAAIRCSYEEEPKTNSEVEL